MYSNQNKLQTHREKMASQRQNIAVSPRQMRRMPFDEQLVIIMFGDRKRSDQIAIDMIARSISMQGACWLSQQTFADAIGVTVGTANRNLNKLAKDGLIAKDFRYFRTCLYQLPKLLFRRRVRMALSYWMPALSTITKLKGKVERAYYNKIVPLFVGFTTSKICFYDENLLSHDFGEPPYD